MKKINTKKITLMAMFIAISVVLVAIVHLPLIPAAPFLEYDPADIPILIGTFAYGPLAGVILTFLVSIIQGTTVSAASGIYGILMHLIATGAFVIVAGNIYKIKKSMKGAIVALACGTVCMVTVMVFANILITPFFLGAPVEAVKALILPAIIPFNLLKAGINSVVTFLIYKPISKHILSASKTKVTVED
ncbi:MAG: ECF transporter S component [Oscillospiraceae bacterium]